MARSDEENLFIKEILDQHGEYISDLLSGTIESKNLIKTEELLSGIYYTVKKGIRDSWILSFSFPVYGRFIEISFHKSRTLKKWARFNSNRELFRARSREDIKPKKHKDTRWYTRNVYGSMNTLIGRIGSEFTEQERLRLRNIIQASIEKGTYSQVMGSSTTNTYVI